MPFILPVRELEGLDTVQFVRRMGGIGGGVEVDDRALGRRGLRVPVLEGDDDLAVRGTPSANTPSQAQISKPQNPGSAVLAPHGAIEST